jgi:hypothetical protein
VGADDTEIGSIALGADPEITDLAGIGAVGESAKGSSALGACAGLSVMNGKMGWSWLISGCAR